MQGDTEGRQITISESTAELAVLLGSEAIRELTDDEMEYVIGGDQAGNNSGL